MTPTQRSIKHLKDAGYLVAKVEHWNPFAHIRQDLFGIHDLVAIKEGENGVLGIQTTSDSNLSARRTKALSNEALRVWLKAGNRFHLHGWGKKGGRGKRKVWTLRQEDVRV